MRSFQNDVIHIQWNFVAPSQNRTVTSSVCHLFRNLQQSYDRVDRYLFPQYFQMDKMNMVSNSSDGVVGSALVMLAEDILCTLRKYPRQVAVSNAGHQTMTLYKRLGRATAFFTLSWTLSLKSYFLSRITMTHSYYDTISMTPPSVSNCSLYHS